MIKSLDTKRGISIGPKPFFGNGSSNITVMEEVTIGHDCFLNEYLEIIVVVETDTAEFSSNPMVVFTNLNSKCNYI